MVADAAWDKGYAYLRRFAAREHHTRVPAKHLEDGYRLGQWVTVQRTAHRAGQLAKDLSARLAAVPGWEWNPLDAGWEKGYSYLERFAAREGHAWVAQAYFEDTYRLGQWVGVQRRAHRAGRLSDERAARLEALPGWHWTREAAAWEERFSDLERFAARQGHALVRLNLVEDGYRLGLWVRKQRAAHRAGRLSQRRAARLAAVPGWDWRNTRNAGWEQGYDSLRRYAAREGHTRVPQNLVQDHYRLGQWVSKQRAARRAGRLSEQRAARLEALPGWAWRVERGLASRGSQVGTSR